ncbi:MAG TPA: hypothetical protein VE544_11115 [Nitrososphaeraceae archaeon]|jgi:hypothetical protein|nr:hypothetical protein [Nitrososphaeraceae archaeon]
MIDKFVFEVPLALPYGIRFILPSLLCSVWFFIPGLTIDTSAQEVIDTKQGDSLNDVPCKPMMSNATIPVPDEDVLPPEMYMIYRDGVYLGELSQSKYREGETFSNLGILPENISSDLPAETIEIKNGTCAQFIVRGTPSTLPPDSLDISAYSIDGASLGVLNATEDNTSTFRIDLPSGAYILLATSTWIPSGENEYVTGYVIYKFLTNVT